MIKLTHWTERLAGCKLDAYEKTLFRIGVVVVILWLIGLIKTISYVWREW